jgi:hypothetical protein
MSTGWNVPNLRRHVRDLSGTGCHLRPYLRYLRYAMFWDLCWTSNLPQHPMRHLRQPANLPDLRWSGNLRSGCNLRRTRYLPGHLRHGMSANDLHHLPRRYLSANLCWMTCRGSHAGV